MVLRFPVAPSKYTAEFKLNRQMAEAIATASKVGAVTVTPTTLSVSFTPRPLAMQEPAGCIAMDVNKEEHATADTNGWQGRVRNGVLAHARTRRRKQADYHRDRNLWRQWRRKKAYTNCLYLIDRDDAAPINMLRRRLLLSDGEPVAGSGDGPRVAGDWEQRVDGLVNRLVGTVCVRFPRVYDEGRRLKWSAKKPLDGADARVLDDRPDASKRYETTRPAGRMCL